MAEFYFLYLLECSNGAYYTGITINPDQRWQEHLRGRASKYTRSFVPKRMVGLWRIEGDRALAQQLEYRVKKFSRQEKEAIIAEPATLNVDGLVGPCKKPFLKD